LAEPLTQGRLRVFFKTNDHNSSSTFKISLVPFTVGPSLKVKITTFPVALMRGTMTPKN
jgi:hypothetical protein